MENRTEMAELFTVSRGVKCTPEGVLSFLAMAMERPQWCPGVLSISGAPPGAASPGDGWQEERDVFGLAETEHVTVVTSSDPAAFVFEVDGTKGTARSGRLRFEWRATPNDDGSHVSVSCLVGEFSRKGVILARFLIGPFARQAEAELAALARAVDCNDIM